MAGDDSAQEKTEEATPKRLEKSKEDGQAPRSKELTTTAVLLTGAIGLLIFGPYFATKLRNIFQYNFSFSRETAFDPQLMFTQLGHSFYEALFGLIPLFSMLLLAAIIGPIALGGWLFSTKAMMPKLSRMNPIEGLKRMFSVKALVELGKALGKVVFILTLTIILLKGLAGEFLGLASEDIEEAIVHSTFISVWVAIALSAVTILIALVDIPFQIWDHSKKLKMSLQEVKDEMKDSEGKPEVKGRIRQLQRELANRRMMADVPEADVIITNPTHYAIGLKYDPESMSTPQVIARGVDHVALKIREIANAHQIEVVESPVLARAIYHTTKVDEEIPSALYIAVAKVLAYVFQLRSFRKGQGERPAFPHRVDVPDDMIFDP